MDLLTMVAADTKRINAKPNKGTIKANFETLLARSLKSNDVQSAVYYQMMVNSIY